MKVSKKSLIASIAVLCVCALSLTAASFAWFSASETAQVKDLVLDVKAQSDIKLSANPGAISDSAHEDWKTTLVEKDFLSSNGNKIEDEIADATPTADTFNGGLKTLTADARKRIDSNSGEVLTGEAALSDADYTSATLGSHYADFKVYVRTTEKKDVVINFSDFRYVVENEGTYIDATGANAVDALRLGYVGGNNADVLANASSGKVVVSADKLTAFDDGNGFYGEVTFYVWVEGTDAACATKNALSLKNYLFGIDFAYAA